jgi:hypothetical protein
MRLTSNAKQFKDWLTTNFDTRGCEALIHQLVADFQELERLRERANKAREAGDDNLYLRYCAAITKLTASFIRTWRCAGLAGVELPPEVATHNRRQ